jgi:hypothetical protein
VKLAFTRAFVEWDARIEIRALYERRGNVRTLAPVAAGYGTGGTKLPARDRVGWNGLADEGVWSRGFAGPEGQYRIPTRQ